MTNIPDNEIHLWFVHEHKLEDEDIRQSWEALLSDDEVRRYQRKIYPEHKDQFLLSRALLRSVLAAYLGRAPAELSFKVNSQGKPFIEGIEFNLSHTRGLTVLAVAAKHSLGVDIESLSRELDVSKLGKRYFSPAENKTLNMLAEEHQREFFFDLWTLKEAYVKARGIGLVMSLRNFSFELSDEHIAVSFRKGVLDHPDAWFFWHLHLNSGHRLALALHGREGRKAKMLKLHCYQGLPLQGFSECFPEILRHS